jgi:tetratricopeptide (TPR) repeat protein
LLAFARELGAPAWLLSAGGVIGAMFLLGEPFQKNLKAWRENLSLKPEPASKGSPAPEPLPPAPWAPIAGQTVSGNDNQSLQQTSAGGNLMLASAGAVLHNESIGRDLVQRDQLRGDQYNAPATVTHAQTVNYVYPASEPKRQRILSTIAPPPQGVGVMGREQELAELDARLGEPGNNRRLVVHGESGVGKSELLREYGRRHEARYPAGRYWIDCRLNLASELASLGRQCWQMAWLEGPLEEQAREVLQHLAKEKVLLLFDNASHEGQVQPFLPPAGQAHVLLSSTSRDWGPPLVEVWRPEGLQRLDPPTALAVLESVAGKAVAEQVGERVIAELGSLPVHLLPTARTLARKARHGRLSEGQLVQLSNEGIDSFSLALQALEPAARLLLQAAGRWFNPNALVEAELVAALAESFQGEAVVRNAVDACRDLYLLQGEGRLTMHQLLVKFVQAQPPQRLAGIGAEDLAPAVAAALGEAAKRLEEAPADGEALAALQCHQLGWEFWRQHPNGPSAGGCHHIGEGLFVMGQFAEASRWFEAAAALIRREAELDHLALGDNLHELGICAYQQGQWPAAAGWFEQAVAEKRQGDLHGRVDHESLGSSLHQLGNCVYQQGEWPEAAGWFEQAVAETSQGDLHGRVDHESLGSSLHGLGNCAFQQGEWPAAVGWFKQAVAETSQGVLHGRVDHESLGKSLHQLGMCACQQEQWPAAAVWFKQALAETSQGDLHGRVDHESLGSSLHGLGNCAFQQGEWPAAAGWCEQAVAEMRQGDLHGRVDHASLGKSLHQLGNCAYQQGQWPAAAGWFKQALAETSQGDLHGRVDHESLGSSLHGLGNCAFQQGEWPAAAGWFEQAVAEARQGDLHGRVDHESLGMSLLQLGNCAYQQGQWPTAAGWFEQALAEMRKGDIFGRVDQGSVANSEKSLVLCRKKMGLA